ncbi:alpha-amylase/4-alpha-glucanotransferase domain-containing protein [Thiobacter aerophilum]|uniref:Alpha-amylase/4-alpha-glucanotransferase domain-containing protein n=1 Tax=Thiobacter aerophilum TaxID=3121275 RepID=A0ABV0EGQ7_9BURK
MTETVALLFGVHAHQPVGNFPQVLEDAHRRCYRPFLHTLHRFPEFRFAAHFSGWLLDYLLEKFPEDMRLLQEMVARGQVELFGAGETEPVLAVIPASDRVGQIRTLSDKLERRFGARPRGAWLTERVWEATVVPALADAGIEYVTVDDYHFLCTGRRLDELTGYFTTEEDGRRLDLFPISEALRYRLPFAPAQEAVRYIEGLVQGGNVQPAAIYFDDIEKFGIWPETYEWVYERGWLTDFIQGVLASPVIRPMRFDEYRNSQRTRGVIYVPTTSYSEMNEWTLPAEAASRYAELVERAKREGRFEGDKPFLRGGIWKNFFSRYPESNWMHKRMLELSRRLHALPGRHEPMRHLLYQAQANDAYWHGLFGGLYLPHLRRAVYHAIVRLEALLDQAAPRPSPEVKDLDLDGVDELFLHNTTLQAVVKLDQSASVCELDAYVLGHNFGDTLARQVEHYYRKVRAGNSVHAPHVGEGIASAHDRVSFKHEIHAEDLRPDAHPRTSFRDSWCGETEPQPLVYRQAKGGGPVFEAVDGFIQVRKTYALSDNRLEVEYVFGGAPRGTFTTELNLAMPSCDGPAGRYLLAGHIPGGFGEPLLEQTLEEIELVDDVLGGSLVLRVTRPARLEARPHHTVSQSEAGFEKIMQAVTLRLAWPVASAGERLVVSLEVRRQGQVSAT